MAVVHYPSRRHFLDLLTNPQYLTKADFKSYAMHMALVPVKRELVIPDFHQLAIAGAVVVFLLVGWILTLTGGVICPLLSGPISILELVTKEEWNGKEAQAGRDHRQAA